MILDGRAELLELRKTGENSFEWVRCREVRVAVREAGCVPETQESARLGPLRLLLSSGDVRAGQVLLWRGGHWEICAVRRESPVRCEVLASPVRAGVCELRRPAGPGQTPEAAGSFPGMLREVVRLDDERAGEAAAAASAAIQMARMRAVLSVPREATVEPGDLLVVDGAGWTVRCVAPGGAWENRCDLERRVDV